MTRKRYGISTAEDFVANMMDSLKIKYERYRYVCFRCGHVGRVNVQYNRQGKLASVDHPKKCYNCYQQFGLRKFQHCQPDFYFESGKNKAILMVNGDIYHTDDEAKKKDEIQIEKLTKLGFKVFVLFTEDMNHFIESLPEWFENMYLAINDNDLYLQMCKKYKVGLCNYASFEFFMDEKLSSFD